MVSILFWGSIYFLVATYILLFFGCSSYYKNPCVSSYSNEICGFYDKFVVKMEMHEKKVSTLFFSDTFVGSYYRHFLVKDYLKSEDKLRELEFTEKEIETINELIVPGFEERIILFNMLKVILVFLTIILGVVVGLFI